MERTLTRKETGKEAKLFVKEVEKLLQSLKKMKGFKSALVANYDGLVVASTSKSELIDTTAILATVRTSAASECVRIHGGELLSILTEGTKGLCLYVPIGWLGVLVVLLTRDADIVKVQNEARNLIKKLSEKANLSGLFTRVWL